MQLQAGASAFRLAGAIFMMATVRAPSVLSWSVLYLITGIIPSIFGIALVNKELGRYIFGMKIVKAEILEGFYFSVSQSSQTIYNDIDKTLLASMASLEVAGLYTAAHRFYIHSHKRVINLVLCEFFQTWCGWSAQQLKLVKKNNSMGRRIRPAGSHSPLFHIWIITFFSWFGL
jgi:hypothetical protein